MTDEMKPSILAWQNSACGDFRLIMKLKAHRWHNAKNTVEATGWHKENQLHPAAQHIPKCSLPALGWKYPSISLCRYDVHQGKQSFFKAGSALGHHSSCISHSFQLSSHNTPICVLLSQLLHFPFFGKTIGDKLDCICITVCVLEKIRSSDRRPSCQL